MKKKYVFVAMTNPVDGREDEYNAWYSTTHVDDALKIDGFVSAQRFRLAADQRRDVQIPWRYLAIYEIETDDIATVVAELGRRVGTELMPLSPALAPGLQSLMYEAVTEKKARPDA